MGGRADAEWGAWWTLAATGVLAGLPFVLNRFLPLVDWPLHQLELAVWIDLQQGGERFGSFYTHAEPWFPYWGMFWLARPFVGLGVELAARITLLLYAIALPLCGGALARSVGRSAWWGLLLVPFVVDANLAMGFVPYCLGGVLALGMLALSLRNEASPNPAPGLVAQAVLALCLGWTHPQMALLGTAAVCAVQLVGGAGLRRKLLVGSAALPAVVLPVYWVLQGGGTGQLAHEPIFASFGTLLLQLPRFSIDVFPGPVEEALLLAGIALIAIAWHQRGGAASLLRERSTWLAAFALLLYFVAPWDLNGQAICQRFPYLALLLLPALAPPAFEPPRWMCVALTALALLGAANVAYQFDGFDRDTRAELEPLLSSVEPGAKVVYVGYDLRSPWVNSEVYTHAGAWLLLEHGACYAFNFDRLTVRHRPTVPPEQRMIGREFAASRKLMHEGAIGRYARSKWSFWDTIAARWHPQMPPVMPFRFDGPEPGLHARTARWGLWSAGGAE